MAFANISPSETFRQNPLQYLRSLRHHELKTLDNLLYKSVYRNTDYASQTWRGEYIGVCRQTMNGTLKKFSEEGLLLKQSQGFKKTNLHFLPRCFWEDNYLLHLIRSLLPSADYILRVKNCFLYSEILAGFQVEKVRKMAYQTLKMSLNTNNSIYSTKKHTDCNVADCHKCRERGETGGEMIPYPSRILGRELTEWGQAKIRAYPLKVVTEIDQSVQSPERLKNPMAYFETLCRNECNFLTIRPDYDLVRRIIKERKLDINGPCFIEVPQKPKISSTLLLSNAKKREEEAELLRVAEYREREKQATEQYLSELTAKQLELKSKLQDPEEQRKIAEAKSAIMRIFGGSFGGFAA